MNARSQPVQTLNNINVGDFLKKQQKQIEVALPKHLDATRLLRIVMTELRKTPKLKECTPHSFIGAVIQCSQLGLEPGNALGHAYLIPYKDECQFMIGYRGMIDLARRSGQVISLSAHVVYENDLFEFEYGLSEKLKHIPTRGDRGQIIGAYAMAHLKDGGHQIEVMFKNEIDKIRDKSSSYSYWVRSGKKNDAPIWEVHYDEMAKKTVIRRLFKYLPVSIEIQRAVTLDEAADRGEQDNSAIFDGEFENVNDEGYTTTHKSKTESVLEKLEPNNLHTTNANKQQETQTINN